MLILIQHDNVLDEGEKTFQTYLRKIEVRKDLMGFKSLFLLSQKANFNLVLAVSQNWKGIQWIHSITLKSFQNIIIVVIFIAVLFVILCYKYQGYIQEYGQLPHVFPQSLVPTTDKQQVI